MAKKSKILKNEQRRATVAKFAAKRAALKETLRKLDVPAAEKLLSRQ